MNIIVMGPAGSGKSLFTKNFGEFLRQAGYSVCEINLDPASPPVYTPCRDIRKFVKAEEIMGRFGLGINGALLKSMELAEEKIEEIIPENDNLDFALYDTPGQLELFLYTDFGQRFVKALSSFSLSLFLVDSTRIKTPAQYSAIITQASTVTLMLGLSAVIAFNKSDMSVLKNPSHYIRGLKDEGMLGEYYEGLMKFIELTNLTQRIVNISAKTWKGFDELFSILNEVFCVCGDLS